MAGLAGHLLARDALHLGGTAPVRLSLPRFVVFIAANPWCEYPEPLHTLLRLPLRGASPFIHAAVCARLYTSPAPQIGGRSNNSYCGCKTCASLANTNAGRMKCARIPRPGGLSPTPTAVAVTASPSDCHRIGSTQQRMRPPRRSTATNRTSWSAKTRLSPGRRDDPVWT